MFLGVLGAADPQNDNCCDFDPQKAPPWVIPSLLGVYALKSVHWFGQAAIPRNKKKKQKSHTRSIFGQISPRRGGATGYSNSNKFGSLIWPRDLITHAHFKLDRLRTGCVAL